MSAHDFPEHEKDVFHYADRAQKKVVKSINDFSEVALGELKQWIEQAGLSLPISTIQGFSQFAPQQAFIATSESTSSTSYTDLATAGPEITGLSAGRYLLIFGCIYDSASGSDGFMSPSVNGATAVDADAAYAKAAGADRYNIVRAVLKTMSDSNSNSVKMKYRVSGTTNSFENRWLVLMRVSNA